MVTQPSHPDWILEETLPEIDLKLYIVQQHSYLLAHYCKIVNSKDIYIYFYFSYSLCRVRM